MEGEGEGGRKRRGWGGREGGREGRRDGGLRGEGWEGRGRGEGKDGVEGG